MLQNNYGRLAIVTVFIIVAIILIMAPGMQTKPSNDDQLNFTSMPKDSKSKEVTEKPVQDVNKNTQSPVSTTETLISPEQQMLNDWGMQKTSSQTDTNRDSQEDELSPEDVKRQQQIRITPLQVEPENKAIQPQVPEKPLEQAASQENTSEQDKAAAAPANIIKVGDKCYTFPKQASSMDKAECDTSKEALGINACPAEGQQDAWAGAVKACGTVNAMPTMDDLFELAGVVYRGNSFTIPDRIKQNYKAYGTYSPTSGSSDNLRFRDLVYQPEKAKSLGLPSAPGYSVWGKVEISPIEALALSFEDGVVTYTSATLKTSQNFYTICRVPCK